MSHRHWGVPIRPSAAEPLLAVAWRNRRHVAIFTACYGGSAVISAIICVPVFRLIGAGMLIAWMLAGGK